MRRQRAGDLWQDVALDASVLEVVQPFTGAWTARGDALPLGEFEWRAHLYRLGEQMTVMPLYRLWYPELRINSLSETRSPWGNDVSTAAYLFIRHRMTRMTGGAVRDVILAFTRYAQYLTEIRRWDPTAHPTELFSRSAVAGFGKWADTKWPGSAGKSFGYILAFLRWTAGHDIPGMSRDVLHRLRGLRAQACVAAHIARLGHPTFGALVEQERAEVLRSLNDPAPEHDPMDRALVGLAWELGLRQVQIAALTWGMLVAPDGVRSPYLVVPRAKRSKDDNRSVSHRSISDRLYSWLVAARRADATQASPIFGGNINRRFLQWGLLHEMTTLRAPKGIRKRSWLRRYEINGVTVWRLRLTAHRLRRTMATRLAELGAGALTIMAALDDDSLVMATIYAANSSSMIRLLKETLDKQPDWIRVIRIFSGTLVHEPNGDLPVIPGGALHLADATRYVRDVGIIGRCALTDECDRHPPLDCYRCQWFRGVRDPGVHRRQLAQLIDELTVNEGKHSDRMAVILKDSALATAEVVRIIEHGTARLARRAIRDRSAQIAKEAER